MADDSRIADDGRIAQLRALVEGDPNDELAHFSLGSVLLEAGRPEEASPCFQRVLAINSGHSRAYQLLGMAQKTAGHAALAVETLTNGYRVAHRKGDMMPMKAMEELLVELGAEVPAVGGIGGPARVRAGGHPGDGAFACQRCGGSGPKLEERPFKGDLGERILASVCRRCWDEWVSMGTKVINELQLPMYDPQAQEIYDKHMKEFLMLE